MKKKFMSALLFGALLAAPASMFVSCKDYDDDISELRGDITTNATDLTSLVTEKMKNVVSEVNALKAESETLKTAYETADRNLSQAIATATNDAKGYADIQAAEAQKAAIAAAQTLVDNAIAKLEASLYTANQNIEANASKIEALVSESKNMSSSLDKANASIAAQAEKIAALTTADKTLQDGIDAAQARAEQAYSLAEKACESAEKVAADLKSTTENLTTLISNINTNITAVDAKVAEAKALAEKNAANLEKQQTVLNELKSNQAVYAEKLDGQKAELTALISANSDKITKLEAEVANAKAAAEKSLADAKAYTDAQLALVKTDMVARISGVETSIENILKSVADNKNLSTTNASKIEEILKSIASINNDIANAKTELAGQISGVSNSVEETLKLIKTVEGTTAGNTEKIEGILKSISGIESAAAANQAGIAENKETIAKLSGSIADIKEALAKVQGAVDAINVNALNNKITELDSKIASTVATAKSELQKEIEKATGIFQTQLDEKLNDLMSASQFAKAKAEITLAYTNADKALEKDLRDSIRNVSDSLDRLGEKVKKIQAIVNNVNPQLGVMMYNNVYKMVTGVVLQGFGYANNVTAAVGATGATYYGVYGYISKDAYGQKADGKEMFKKDDKSTLYFPYATAPGAVGLPTNQVYSDPYAGDVYITVNPTDISLKDWQDHVTMTDGEDKESSIFELGTPEAASAKFTRSATEGLYRIPVKVKSGLSLKQVQEYSSLSQRPLYAVGVSYNLPLYDEEKMTFKDNYRRVLSAYGYAPRLRQAPKAEAKLTYAATGENQQIATEGTTRAIGKSSADFGLGIVNGDPGQSGKAYKTYLTCTQVGNETDGKNAAEFNNANAGILATVHEYHNNVGTEIKSVTCPSKFLNTPITFKYYVLSFDGSVDVKTYTFRFSQPLWGDVNVIENTQLTNPWRMLKQQSIANEAFVKSAGPNGEKWFDAVSKIEVQYLKLHGDKKNFDDALNAKIRFFNGKNKSSENVTGFEWHPTVSNGTASTTITKTANFKAENFQSVEISYSPQIAIGQTYGVEFIFKNSADEVLNTIFFNATLSAPASIANTSWRKEGVWDNNKAYVWANYSGDSNSDGYIKLNGLFTGIDNGVSAKVPNGTFDANGNENKQEVNSPYVISYQVPNDYKSKAELGNDAKADGQYYDRKLVKFPDYANGFEMVVPNEAMKKHHEYAMKANLQQYGLSSLLGLWSDNFTIIVASPVEYALKGTKGIISGSTYAGLVVKELNDKGALTDKDITVSYGADKREVSINCFYMKNPKDGKVLPLKKGDLIKNISFGHSKDYIDKIELNAAGDKVVIIPRQDADKPALIKEMPVTCTVNVKDVWGVTTEKEFTIVVRPNI